MSFKTVIIIGAGFGGLSVAKRLAKEKNINVKIFDKNNHHLFQPLLYQVATAGLSPADIAIPIRSIFSKHKNVDVYLAEVKDIQKDKKTISTSIGDFQYDYLVIAAGAEHSYFGHEEWEDFAPGLKTIPQATEIRRRVLLSFEKAESSQDKEEQKKYLTFVIVGGGPTGVELAGALAEISYHTLSQDFRNIDPKKTRIILVESGKRVLASFSESSSRKAQKSLKKMGVEVITNSLVTQIEKDKVKIKDDVVHAGTVIWAAGVKPNKLSQNLELECDRVGRVVVKKDLTLPGYKDIFAIGDMVHFEYKDKALPGVAPVALQQGACVAKNIKNALSSKEYKEFQYFDKGNMATIGRSKACVEAFGFKVTGFIAWLMWLFVHIYFLIGFRNKVFVILQWFTAYIFFSRGARLIVDKTWKSFQKEKK